LNILVFISLLLALCATFSFINVRFLKLPQVIGLMIISLFFSVLLIVVGKINDDIYNLFKSLLIEIDLSKTLLNIMLGFLLFAGALHIDITELKKQRAAVIAFSTISLIISVFLFGSIIWWVFQLFQYPIGFIYCLWLGSVVSPTDPIAVIGILKKSNMPKSIEAVINGESLFNYGVGVVIFVTIGRLIDKGIESVSVSDVFILFSQEVFGGIAFGLLAGYITLYLVKKINHYQTEVLISIAVVMLCGTISQLIHVSGPLAVIIVGLLLGSKINLSETSRDYYFKFWELIDDFLNTILFVLIGLQVVLFPFMKGYFAVGIIAIVVLLICRYISLAIPVLFLKDKKLYNGKILLIMTWGGLRGGLAIALILSLPNVAYKELMVSVTYLIVLFSIIVQGLTTGKLVKKLY
jgi:CPA1 family monovalent cation:H+ antiporter